MKRFDCSLEWLSERIAIREEEIEKIKNDGLIEERAKKRKDEGDENEEHR